MKELWRLRKYWLRYKWRLAAAYVCMSVALAIKGDIRYERVGFHYVKGTLVLGQVPFQQFQPWLQLLIMVRPAEHSV